MLRKYQNACQAIKVEHKHDTLQTLNIISTLNLSVSI